jgi:hypothetical protein
VLFSDVHFVAEQFDRDRSDQSYLNLYPPDSSESRYVFIGRIRWLAARDGLIDTQAWRVNLREYSPIARFGASFYTRTHDRFSLNDAPQEAPPAATSVDQL